MNPNKKNVPLQTIETTISNARPTASVIWMHGLGADGHDFAGVIPELKLSANHAIRFIFPHASFKTISICGNTEMRAWFDIKELGTEIKLDSDGIKNSADEISLLIEKEISSGIKSNCIFLAGFSQGAVMALHCGLRYVKPLGGIIALSGFLALPDTLNQEKEVCNQNIPIFLAHGEKDPLIPLNLAYRSYEYLQKNGYQITWKTYLMEHTVCQEELEQIGTWLNEKLISNR